MILELHSTEVAPIAAPVQYTFVLDTDLVHIGGGSALVDY